MVGSAGIGTAIAHVVFWVLTVRAWIAAGPRTAAIFVGLWLAGYVGLPLVGGGLFFASWVAVLDIAIVLVVFKGDAPLFRSR